MASSVVPEKLDSGDIASWLRQFEVCATANFWDAEKKLKMLPAFLRGPAATQFHAMDGEGYLREAHQAFNCSFVPRS